MGLFNGYLKEGPGVDKNAKKKKGIFLYFDILFRKFFKLLKANCLYILFSIPFIAVILMFVAPYVMSTVGINPDTLEALAKEAVDASISAGNEIADTAQEVLRISSTYYWLLTSMFTVLIFNFFGAGPVSAAYAYAMRCYTRGEHTWLLSDGKDQFKENFKYSILLYVINMIMLYVLFTAYYFYGNIQAERTVGYIAVFARPFTMLMVLLLAMMNMFAYQIMVTYECKFKDLLKNSAMISLAKLPMCILLGAVAVAVIYAIFYNIADPIVSWLLYMLIGLMFARFPFEFYAARVLEKNMRNLKRREKKNAEKTTGLNEEE